MDPPEELWQTDRLTNKSTDQQRDLRFWWVTLPTIVLDCKKIFHCSLNNHCIWFVWLILIFVPVINLRIPFTNICFPSLIQSSGSVYLPSKSKFYCRQNFLTSLNPPKRRELHFHAPVGALVLCKKHHNLMMPLISDQTRIRQIRLRQDIDNYTFSISLSFSLSLSLSM